MNQRHLCTLHYKAKSKFFHPKKKIPLIIPLSHRWNPPFPIKNKRLIFQWFQSNGPPPIPSTPNQRSRSPPHTIRCFAFGLVIATPVCELPSAYVAVVCGPHCTPLLSEKAGSKVCHRRTSLKHWFFSLLSFFFFIIRKPPIFLSLVLVDLCRILEFIKGIQNFRVFFFFFNLFYFIIMMF